MNPHEIAQHIVNLKGDLLRVGPSDNAGRVKLYIINEGILELLGEDLFWGGRYMNPKAFATPRIQNVLYED